MVATQQENQSDLQKFWELEDLNPVRELTPDERACEEFYQQTHSRDENGIFTVKIPFKCGKMGPERLGLSRNQSIARFLQLEKRFSRDEKLRHDYVKVMKEYITLGHMVPVDTKPDQKKLCYIPHHAVVKPDRLTTKTRVVFDASAKTSTGYFLNECMHAGAKQQRDMWDTLINWRKYKIVFKADIEKMYRMIKLHEDEINGITL